MVLCLCLSCFAADCVIVERLKGRLAVALGAIAICMDVSAETAGSLTRTSRLQARCKGHAWNFPR